MFSLSFLSKAGFHPRNGASDGYPFDLDASLRFVRPKTGIDVFPSHNNAGSFAKYGLINGFVRQQDIFVWAQGYGAYPGGPIMSALPVNLQWQMNIPGMNKYQPQ